MPPDGPLRVAAFPAGRPGMSNPYASLFTSALRSEGAVVDDLRVGALFRTRYDVVHLHWPEWILDSESRRRAEGLLAGLAWQRRRGGRVVWTVHNLGHHEQARKQSAWKRFLRRVDGFVSLTEGGVGLARDAFPELRDVPAFVVPHGHYRDVYPNDVSVETARDHLEIAADAKVGLFFGHVRPYKNVLALIRVLRELDDPDAVLVVAGRPLSDDLAAAIAHEARGDPRIRLHLGVVPVDEVQHFFNAADVVALPYTETLNSGAALLALSFNRPVVAPASGAFPELQARLGEQWVSTYEGELNGDVLRAALRTTREHAPSAPLDSYAWSETGRLVLDAYHKLLQRPRPFFDRSTRDTGLR
ncbi:MAG: glycosyltransferase [Actinomycetia bacterium]|nr:glycosyltransferase [Actinomycetes bacterium]